MKRTSIGFKWLLTLSIYLLLAGSVRATNYTVATLSTLVSSMSAAVGGDTIIVSNGTYNWGQINFTNNNNSGSQWIKIEISQEMNNDPLSTAATHFAEGNIYNSSAGLGNISNAWLFSTTMNFGTRLQGILSAPLLVQDASLNSNTYTALLETIDEQGHIRNCIYDIGATGNVKYSAIISVQNGKMINFNIYPNPVTSTLVISNLATNTLVKIVNSLGQTVLQQRTTAQSFTLDVSELTKGIYFIQVNGENGKIGSRMFTKE